MAHNELRRLFAGCHDLIGDLDSDDEQEKEELKKAKLLRKLQKKAKKEARKEAKRLKKEKKKKARKKKKKMMLAAAAASTSTLNKNSEAWKDMNTFSQLAGSPEASSLSSSHNLMGSDIASMRPMSLSAAPPQIIPNMFAYQHETPQPPAFETATTTSLQWVNATKGNSISRSSQIFEFMFFI